MVSLMSSRISSGELSSSLATTLVVLQKSILRPLEDDDAAFPFVRDPFLKHFSPMHSRSGSYVRVWPVALPPMRLGNGDRALSFGHDGIRRVYDDHVVMTEARIAELLFAFAEHFRRGRHRGVYPHPTWYPSLRYGSAPVK